MTDKSQNKTNQKIIDSYDYLTTTASTQDLTGLIPAKPSSEAEIESYQELYPTSPQEAKMTSAKADGALSKTITTNF